MQKEQKPGEAKTSSEPSKPKQDTQPSEKKPAEDKKDGEEKARDKEGEEKKAVNKQAEDKKGEEKKAEDSSVNPREVSTSGKRFKKPGDCTISVTVTQPAQKPETQNLCVVQKNEGEKPAEAKPATQPQKMFGFNLGKFFNRKEGTDDSAASRKQVRHSGLDPPPSPLPGFAPAHASWMRFMVRGRNLLSITTGCKLCTEASLKFFPSNSSLKRTAFC